MAGNTLSKPDFIAKVAESAKLSKADAEKAVNATLDTIVATLNKGDSVQFVGFGAFEVRTRAARKGINPKTKKPLNIAAKKAVAFKAGKKLKDAVA
ncbi:MAG: HU family DNA-binding protein [Helicobacteraceae bacterium]|jgi:DNA-binding protein HU-beta|nr:HU family DNA-binding protein [Helicobacteraceae bacterium]MDR2034940.1 HU family DNA-binding protein [Helicobacteraceae bacterium]